MCSASSREADVASSARCPRCSSSSRNASPSRSFTTSPPPHPTPPPPPPRLAAQPQRLPQPLLHHLVPLGCHPLGQPRALLLQPALLLGRAQRAQLPLPPRQLMAAPAQPLHRLLRLVHHVPQDGRARAQLREQLVAQRVHPRLTGILGLSRRLVRLARAALP